MQENPRAPGSVLSWAWRWSATFWTMFSRNSSPSGRIKNPELSIAFAALQDEVGISFLLSAQDLCGIFWSRPDANSSSNALLPSGSKTLVLPPGSLRKKQYRHLFKWEHPHRHICRTTIFLHRRAPHVYGATGVFNTCILGMSKSSVWIIADIMALSALWVNSMETWQYKQSDTEVSHQAMSSIMCA